VSRVRVHSLLLFAVLGSCACTHMGASAALANAVRANCDTPLGRDSCSHWYRVPWVSLSWQWDAGGMIKNGCAAALFTTEQARTVRSCTIAWSGTETKTTVWIGIDRTPPQLLGLQTNRPPDYFGWFNHPVGYRFRVSDRTSGVASCGAGTYAGPDGEGIPISGSCRDVAGNIGSGSFRLNYDATPPPPPRVRVTPGNQKVALRWSAPGVVSTRILRWRTGHAAKVVFSGGRHEYRDRRLRNGRRYRYAIIGTDRAGNQAVTKLFAVPTRSKLLSPPRGARLAGPPMLVWKKVRRASYYNVQLYRGGLKVLTTWPRRAALRLGRHWTYAGRTRRLARGRYRWYVWPGYGRLSARRYGRLLGRSSFTIVR
jgi:hypothetical protein